MSIFKGLLKNKGLVLIIGYCIMNNVIDKFA